MPQIKDERTVRIADQIDRFTNIPANSDTKNSDTKPILDLEDTSKLSIAQSRAMSLIDTNNFLIYGSNCTTKFKLKSVQLGKI